MLFGKYVNKFYKKYFTRFFFGVAFLIFVDIIQLQMPSVVSGMAKRMDLGLLTQHDILIGGLKIIGIGVGMFLGRFIWRICILSTSFDIAADLRKDMFSRTLMLSERFYRENKTGGLMAYYTNDIDTIQESFSWGLVMLIDAVFLSALTLIKMGMTNITLTLISLIPLGLLVILSYFIDRKMNDVWTQRQNAFSDLEDYAQETFSGLRVIKAFVKEKTEASRFAKVNKVNMEKDVKLAKFNAFLNSMFDVTARIVICIGMAVGGVMIYDRFIKGNAGITLDSNQMFEFMMYFDTIIWPMIALGNVVSLIARAKTSLKRITGYLDEKIEIVDKEDVVPLQEDVKGQIEFRDFTYAYPDGTDPVLKNISMTIKPGETIGIVGKIGSGKSTLGSVLLRSDNLEKGKVFIDGHDIMNIPIKSVRDSIAYVPQDTFLFSTTLSENIAFSDLSMSQEQIEEAAKFADVHNNIVEFVDGYRTLIGERGVTLSGGQKQRLAIARAYAKHAPIMILDDSVSAVDVKTEEAILHNLKTNRPNQTTIIIASRTSTVSHLDKVAVLNEGCLEAFDTPENLLNISPTYRRMVEMQKLENELE